MKIKLFSIFVAVAMCVFLCASIALGQKIKPAAKAPKTIVFAVLGGGTSVEPIAYINGGKLEAAVNGSDDRGLVTAFDAKYYKPGAVYRMVFGAADAGSVTIKSSNSKGDCAPNVAVATSKSAKTTLKGLVMSLATNATIKNKSGVRRKPTAAEKTEIDTLVRAEYLKNKLTPKLLHYHNLTVLDVNNDGKPEMVGSYWIDVDKATRALLFFIAEKGANGKYALGYSDFQSIDQGSVMSGDMKDVEAGILNELLLDAFDYDGDGSSEIFTYTQSFEGSGFAAYKKSNGKWTKAFEGSNYHCGY